MRVANKMGVTVGQEFFSIGQINFFGDFGIMAFSYIVFDALQLGTFRISLNNFIKL